ncbi:hypothetical protein CFC21_050994, partial [Triticum aestivum]
MAPLFQRVLLAVLLLASTASSSFATAGRGGGRGRFDPTRAVHVSWRPRAFLYKGFLSEAECDHLIALERREHPGAPVRERPEVRAARRLHPAHCQGIPFPRGAPRRHRAHVPVRRQDGRRDRLPQLRRRVVAAQRRHMVRVCTKWVRSETCEGRRGALLQPAPQRDDGPGQPARELPRDRRREVVGDQVDPRPTLRQPPSRAVHRRMRGRERSLPSVGCQWRVRQEPSLHGRNPRQPRLLPEELQRVHRYTV